MALRGEYAQSTPTLRQALASFPLGGLQITSIISGPHVPDSAHFEGRAVDVALPQSKAGWDFLVRAILSGKFTRIGTTRAAVDSLGNFARQHGVEMFEDEGTGSHAHLEVGP